MLWGDRCGSVIMDEKSGHENGQAGFIGYYRPSAWSDKCNLNRE